MSTFQERFKNQIGSMGKDGILRFNKNNQIAEPITDDYNFEIRSTYYYKLQI